MLLTCLLAACAGERATSPDLSTGYSTTSELKLLNRTTGQLERVAPESRGGGVMASVVGANTVSARVYATTDLGVATVATPVVTTNTVNGHLVKEVVFYRAGLPPVSDYMLVDNKLTSVATFTWTKIPGGWYMSKSVMTAYSPTSGTAQGTYTTTGEYTQTTVPCMTR